MKTWTPGTRDMAPADLVHHIGYDILGPVVQRWLLALHQQLHYHDDGETAVLYCARAGVRIRDLYDIFRAAQPDPGRGGRMLWASRVAVAKGVFARPGGRDRAIALLTREYYHAPLRDLVHGLMRNCPDRLSGLDLGDRRLDAHGHNLAGWLTVDGPVQRRLTGFLTETSRAFDADLRELTGGAPRALLVDSGWQGTAQSLLAGAYPEMTWRGLYFGRILTPAHDPAIVPDCIGLMFEAEAWDPTRPETAIVRHRHLIEGLLEPGAPSVEDAVGGPADKAARAMIRACTRATPRDEEDALFVNVRRYVRDHAGQSPARILAAHTPAMAELARLVLHPTAAEARVLAGGPRSADFGKPYKVAVLREPDGGSPEMRIDASLWPEGQIALEYPPGPARDLQGRLSGLQNDDSYFDPTGSATPVRAARAARDPDRARVAVITRTKNRPVLFRRAAASVASQTLQDVVWTVVNDGGDPDEVAAIMADTPLDPRRMRLVSHDQSRGMEAASNSGIAACDSDYIVIHDDDDSWLPEFLTRTVAFLDSPGGARYGGVVTHSFYVSEEVRGQTVTEHEARPYNDWVRNVQLSEMACGNFFPPIAFVFRRAVWDRIGGFNEALPVLGDWFFNLEVLLEDDIAVLPEPLARYHHRDRGGASAGAYANSVIGGVSKHEEFAAVARNAFLRRHGDRAGVAASFALGYAVSDLRGRIGREDKPRAAPPAQTPRGTDDRLWCVAELNAGRKRSRPWHLKRPAALPADAGWSALSARMGGPRISLRSPPDFDEAGYRRSNPDVDDAVTSGRIASGYVHYILHGRAEGRPRQTLA